MSGDNIMVVKELAELNFQLKQFPESLLYYKKLTFPGFLQQPGPGAAEAPAGAMLDAGVSDRLADTKAEFRVEIPPAVESPPAVAATVSAAPPPPPVPAPWRKRRRSRSTPLKTPAHRPPLPLPGRRRRAAFPDGKRRRAVLQAGALSRSPGHLQEPVRKDRAHRSFSEDQGHPAAAARRPQNSQIIGKLQRFLELLQQRGSQIV